MCDDSLYDGKSTNERISSVPVARILEPLNVLQSLGSQAGGSVSGSVYQVFHDRWVGQWVGHGL